MVENVSNSGCSSGANSMKLPNAPLSEVVFEFRWSVERIPGVEVVGFDPVFSQFSENLSVEMLKQGFNSSENLAGDSAPVPNSVVYRYKKESNQPFPLYQIGHGIFACNMSTDYEWKAFRKLIADGIDLVFKSHPGSFGKSPQIVGLELRYIDIFDEALLGHSSAERFIRENTQLAYEGHEFFKTDVFEEADITQFKTQRNLKNDPNTKFQLEIGPGKKNTDRVVIAVNKVVNSAAPIDFGTQNRSIRKNILEWADRAHNVTSPFFKSFVCEELMAVFNQEAPADKIAKKTVKKV